MRCSLFRLVECDCVYGAKLLRIDAYLWLHRHVISTHTYKSDRFHTRIRKRATGEFPQSGYGLLKAVDDRCEV